MRNKIQIQRSSFHKGKATNRTFQYQVDPSDARGGEVSRGNIDYKIMYLEKHRPPAMSSHTQNENGNMVM